MPTWLGAKKSNANLARNEEIECEIDLSYKIFHLNETSLMSHEYITES